MILTLIGHDYKYAVEQIMLMLYPDERPVYSPDSASDTAPDCGLSATVRLAVGETYATAVTHIYSGGALYQGTSRVRRDHLTDKLTSDRLLQKIIKLSFYKAASADTGKTPVWGALTGIRPGKIATSLLERGISERRALTALKNEYCISPERASLCIDTAKASIDVKHALGRRDIALYIGIPFCPTRCHYCSFVSHSVEKSAKLIEPFLTSLLTEIDALSEAVRSLNLRIIAVYIGGGTPTTLSAEQLHQLMEKLSASFDLSALKEYTVEAGRPDTITAEKLDAILRGGADRVSINPQTMSDDVLRAIGRRHTAEDVINAFQLAREAGFQCINMDLIAGLPGDTIQGFRSSLEQVLSLKPENVTVHTLSLKRGTKITLENTILPSGDEVSVMLDSAESLLRGGGFVPYYLYRQKFMSGGFENVGWSLKGTPSLYNVLIMEELSTILALGGGGVTKLVDQKSGRIERIFNPKYPYEYIDNIGRVAENKARILRFYTETDTISE